MTEISEISEFLVSYIENVPDEALLEYLLNILRSSDETQETKDDLLYSLLPELGLLDEVSKGFILSKLVDPAAKVTKNTTTRICKTFASNGKCRYGNKCRYSHIIHKTEEHTIFDKISGEKSEVQAEVDDEDSSKAELQEFLIALGLEEIAEEVEGAVVQYLIGIFCENKDIAIESKRELVEQYIFQPCGFMATTDDIMDSIVSFLEAKADEVQHREATRLADEAQRRTDDLQNSLQSIVSEKRSHKMELSQEEVVERARLVKNGFSDTEVLPKYDSKGKETKLASATKPILFIPNKKLESKIRYRDGQIATRQGGKYITVDEKEEYDSGCRGRVKSKGKRGPGVGKGI